jgi:hypothetical protein
MAELAIDRVLRKLEEAGRLAKEIAQLAASYDEPSRAVPAKEPEGWDTGHKPAKVRIARCKADKDAWSATVLREDGTELFPHGTAFCTVTAISLDNLIKRIPERWRTAAIEIQLGGQGSTK